MNELIATGVKFFSQKDEKVFFEWLDSLDIVGQVRGNGRDIHIELKEEQITDDDLHNLIAIFIRYKITMAQLARFVNDDNKEWFAAPTMIWHNKVFLTG